MFQRAMKASDDRRGQRRTKAVSEERCNLISKLNPNSAPFNPRGYDDSYILCYNTPTWLAPPPFVAESSATFTQSSLTRVLTFYRTILESDLGKKRRQEINDYINNGSNSRLALLSHPLAQLFIAPPRERYVHPAVTDACMYALRVPPVGSSSGKGKFCLAASPAYPGYENNTSEDWIGGIIMTLYYGLTPLRAALEEHECEEDSCWICELSYAFENTDESINEGTGQPISMRGVVETLTALVPLSSTLQIDANSAQLERDVAHGLLTRKLYRTADCAAKPLLHEIYQPSNRNQNWVANRIANGARICQYDKKSEKSISNSRERLHFKLHQALNFVVHMLNKSPAMSPGVEFPRLGESLEAVEQEFIKINIQSACYCPITGKTSKVHKDMILLPLNFQRWHRSYDESPNDVISPDSSELFAFEDSDSSDSNSCSPISNDTYRNNYIQAPPISLTAVHGVKFVDLVTDSLDKEMKVQMTCNKCAELNQGGGLHTIYDEVASLPMVLGIKIDVNTEPQNLAFWRGNKYNDLRSVVRKYCKYKHLNDITKREIYEDEILSKINTSVLPQTMYIAKADKGWEVSETRMKSCVEYELTIVITSIHSTWDRGTRRTLWNIWKSDSKYKNETVSQIRERLRLSEVEELSVERPAIEDTVLTYTKLETGQWLLINGPLTCIVDESDVTAFGLPYKYPVCVFYARKTTLNKWSTFSSKKHKAFELALPKNRSLSLKRLVQPQFHPITSTELKLVELGRFAMALDAEYVVTRKINKCPNHILKSAPQCELGRLSCIRADNAFTEPTPFSDFYIEFNVDPIDYRQEYSGLMPDDLNAKASTRWLTTRSFVYRFIRHMVKSKCQFIGHDLFNDFRVIGIVVPSNLIIDTVELFRLSRSSRLLSLKYLAWHVLKMSIQLGHHDSIEDSWASLLLYRYYRDRVSREGEAHFCEMLAHLYSVGYSTNFRAP